MRTKLLLGLAASTLLASSLAAGTASAATESATGATSISCPSEQWYDDYKCTMAYNGSAWYKGDWVAVHRSNGGGVWVNGYSNKSGVFKVTLTNGNNAYVGSDWVQGNVGQGASAGRVAVVPTLRGTILINGGASSLSVVG
ncbi:hypothetical protein [Streptomyces vinaceus]|uniref:hypothetical protein n=1 Tax=Streptomyces vinaceus TaxID=1960 RepID=UPI0036819614